MDEKKVVPFSKSVNLPEAPEYYINEAGVKTSLYEVLIEFKLKTPPEPEGMPLANIRMSPQQAKVLSLILNKHIFLYERDIGEIKIPPDLLKQLDIEKKA